MPKIRKLPWQELAKGVSGLATDVEHEIQVQREAIPLIFVPGIMGSRLRRGSTRRSQLERGMPNMRWDVTADRHNTEPLTFTVTNYAGRGAVHRKYMLVGHSHDPNYLEVANTSPPGDGGDGFEGVIMDYRPFLRELRTWDWGPLSKIFEFPVYAVGYNWTNSALDGGEDLKKRIAAIIAECKKVTGLCEKCIIITHSMGGLVARSATKLSKINSTVGQITPKDDNSMESRILGIIHGVQPANGSAAGYWRMKGGFEERGVGFVLGINGREVTAQLGNIPGGLQLLPNQFYPPKWLRITWEGHPTVEMPDSDPYEAIYKVRAEVTPPGWTGPTSNKYWGLVDPDLLTPEGAPPAANANPGDNDAIAHTAPAGDAWDIYIKNLDDAKAFHGALNGRTHHKRFTFHGVGFPSADVVELHVEPRSRVGFIVYKDPGFQGYFRDAEGNRMQAIMQRPSGDGDGTVPVVSAVAVDDKHAPPPGNIPVNHQHQPAYDNQGAREHTRKAIVALAQMRYNARRPRTGGSGGN
jgi:hypothetical protein